MQFTTQPVSLEGRRKKPQDENSLGFGKLYSDHMFTMRWSADEGWVEATVAPYRNLEMPPASLVLHYGQTIFEGLKAYRNQKGGVNLFRAKDNAARFNRSAARLDLPEVPSDIFVKAIEALIELDHEWIPRSHGTSLYVRPTMIATEPYIGLKSTTEAMFFIITGPVGAYYPEGFNPVKITVSDGFSRAGPGGLGAAKTAANYAASLLAEKEAIKRGFTQVLWLDAAERRYIEEVGAMNILFKIDGKVITPPAGDTILAGITKASVLELLDQWGVPNEEYRLTIDEVIEAHGAGKLEEVFGAGTAAVISPVGQLEYKGKTYDVGDGSAGPTALRLFDELMGIQYGTRPDPAGWITQINPTGMGQQAAD
ncbi:MAG: branched-chain amino acid aminotransferase [Gammaproteobacteria bacterium]|nr:branched-chain amino acid aminotransferase [Gammaproteobacteria bacterium]